MKVFPVEMEQRKWRYAMHYRPIGISGNLKTHSFVIKDFESCSPKTLDNTRYLKMRCFGDRPVSPRYFVIAAIFFNAANRFAPIPGLDS